ncbi:MlaD family protein [Antrihabitans stalactiti]|uniref:MCE family protein n=1 Tax=Antrihabitans stalactiti TaxID=2584121 RepID=A0A848KLU6_9NOCA|nr:MlaD family protein [Antrihabitans stalactiti]NMN99181.1 MCE family protein [Antrihabitans stalactiti]
MQSLKLKARRLFQFSASRPIPTDREAATSQLRLGIVGTVVVVLALIATGVLYVLPLGRATYTAELAEAGSVKIGDDVRIAGIPVGTVKSIDLHTNSVTMTFTVKDDVFIGDQTTLDIRMLTIVGGHYVAVFPAGTTPLGDTVIPPDRVRLPYNLAKAFQDAAQPIREIDGKTLRQNFAALQTSLDGTPDGLRRAGTAIESLVDILVKQNDDVSRSLAIADEYLTAINGSKSLLGELIHRISLLETIVIDKQAEIQEALRVTDQALSRLAVLGPHWETTLKPMAQKLADAVPELQRLGGKLGGAVESVRNLLGRLQPLATPNGVVLDQSSATITAPALCIPVPGKAC